MKAVIIYYSNTGFTQKYASWIKEETGYEIFDVKSISRKDLETYDLVIFGSRISAGRLQGYKQFVKKLNNKTKLIVFATGAAPIAATEIIDTMWNNNLTKEEQENIPHFYFQSGLNYEKMPWGEKMMMRIFAKMLSKKESKTPEETAMAQSVSQSYDISSKEYIMPLVEYVKSL